ncbi:MAG: sensor histidine kinase, partial [Chloroflexota bacterium]
GREVFVAHRTTLSIHPALCHWLNRYILSNAIKYSPAGGTVKISMLHRPGDLHISVSDEGVGIPPGDMERLFTPFRRASNVGSIRGTGLGLSIVKEIVDNHGGSIRVESQIDTGTSVHMVIPAEEA